MHVKLLCYINITDLTTQPKVMLQGLSFYLLCLKYSGNVLSNFSCSMLLSLRLASFSANSLCSTSGGTGLSLFMHFTAIISSLNLSSYEAYLQTLSSLSYAANPSFAFLFSLLNSAVDDLLLCLYLQVVCYHCLCTWLLVNSHVFYLFVHCSLSSCLYSLLSYVFCLCY